MASAADGAGDADFAGLKASLNAEKPISLAYSNVSILPPGFYEVEVYLDSHLAQRGAFAVLEEGQ